MNNNAAREYRWTSPAKAQATLDGYGPANVIGALLSTGAVDVADWSDLLIVVARLLTGPKAGLVVTVHADRIDRRVLLFIITKVEPTTGKLLAAYERRTR
jgi:hypothetical protein